MMRTAFSLLAIMAVIALPVAAASAGDDKTPYLTVTGTGSVNAKPDTALVSLGVLTEAEAAADAAAANNTAMSGIVKALKAAGIEERDLKTANFSIRPRYSHPKRRDDGRQPPPQLVGYAVSNDLSVRIRKLSDTGLILDQAISQGANTVSRIVFTVDKPAKLLAAARRAAMKDAIAKAKTLAEAAGITLGKILEIREGGMSPRPRAATGMRMMMAESAESVPIASGENKFSVNVTVRWALVQ